MGRYTFGIKKKDANMAVKALYRETGIPLIEKYEALLQIWTDLAGFLEAIEEELEDNIDNLPSTPKEP